MKKRLLSMILALGMMLTILPVNAITAWAENGKIIQSGNCGNNVTYDLTQNNDDDADKTYTLTISGNGEMNNYSDYNFGNSPWANVASAITQVVFEGDITTIGNYSFYRCTRLTSITIPNSVISIGNGAFLDCMNLQKITMPDDSNSELQSIGAFAFENCYNLTSITIPSSVQSIGKHAFYLSVGSLKVYWPTVLSDHITVDDELGYNATYYYPGYKSAWDVQKSKISNFRGLDDVRYYCDVTIDANGGSFSDGTKTKVVKKVWSKEKLTQEQVEAIGVPKNAQKAFYGWKYIGFYTEHTDNLEDVVIKDSMTFYADYIGNTVILGQLNNGNELVKGNSYEFTVTIKAYSADSGSPTKKLTFGDVAGTIKDKNGKTVGAEGLEVTLPDGGEKTLTFTFTPNEVGQNKTLTAYLDGLKYKEEEYGPVTSSTTYSVRDRQNAEVTITGLDNTTVKAGKAKEFTVSVTPNDDANTGAKATITVSGANADAVEKIQYKDGETWKDVPDEGLSIDAINNTEFKLITKADANDGDVTITVTAKKANDTEIDKKVAAVTVKKHENAEVTIDGLDGTTVKAGEAQDFTVNAIPNDDTIDKVTFGTTSGEVQWSSDNGNTWTTVPGDVDYSDLTGKQFRVVPAADAANGTVTVTVTAKKADGTEAAKKDASFTVTKKEEPVTPGGGSTGGSENPGENPGGNPGSGSTKPEQETTKRKLEIADGILTSVMVKDENGNLKDITDTITKDLDGKYEIPVGAKVTITAKDAPEGMKFGEWSISDKTLLSDPDVPYTEKDLIFTMPDNPDGVKLSVVYLEESIGEEPNLVEKGALAGTVVVGSAALLYQGHMLGTELYLRYLLPHGAVIPQNRAELAVLLWQDAENPEPVSTTLYSDISDEDSAIQQAARWAVENDLMEQLDADEHPDHFDPFVPVTFSDSIRAWKKAQELKKSVH